MAPVEERRRLPLPRKLKMALITVNRDQGQAILKINRDKRVK